MYLVQTISLRKTETGVDGGDTQQCECALVPQNCAVKAVKRVKSLLRVILPQF